MTHPRTQFVWLRSTNQGAALNTSRRSAPPAWQRVCILPSVQALIWINALSPAKGASVACLPDSSRSVSRHPALILFPLPTPIRVPGTITSVGIGTINLLETTASHVQRTDADRRADPSASFGFHLPGGVRVGFARLAGLNYRAALRPRINPPSRPSPVTSNQSDAGSGTTVEPPKKALSTPYPASKPATRPANN